MELSEFLLARIAEDEAGNRAGPEPESWCDRGEGVHLSYVRALAECEAKRQIVDWHHRIPLPYERDRLLRMLALPYAGHPDYRSEWAP